jgi:hypothetical protein
VIKKITRDPISKNRITKNWAGGVAQSEGPEFKPPYCKKKENYSGGYSRTEAARFPGRAHLALVQLW